MPDPPADSGADSPADSGADSPADSGTSPAARARTNVLSKYQETVQIVLRCADAVAEQWDDEWTTDRSEVADSLRGALEAAGAWAHLPDLLAGATRATGYSLSAQPVANPPYVAATSRGPILRATVSDGRLVVLLKVFEVERDPTRYVRGANTPEEAVEVRFE